MLIILPSPFIRCFFAFGDSGPQDGALDANQKYSTACQGLDGFAGKRIPVNFHLGARDGPSYFPSQKD
jgi:hypothetical protein